MIYIILFAVMLGVVFFVVLKDDNNHYKGMAYMQSTVAGINHYLYSNQVKKGQIIGCYTENEPDNPYDRNAIVIKEYETKKVIGYVWKLEQTKFKNLFEKHNNNVEAIVVIDKYINCYDTPKVEGHVLYVADDEETNDDTIKEARYQKVKDIVEKIQVI